MDSDIYVEITGERRGSDAESSEAKDDPITIKNKAFLMDQDNDMKSVDQSGMLFWCQRCKEMRKAECPIHGKVKVVADTPRLTYAMSSLPYGLYRDQKGGVVSKKMYPVNTVFGPFIAPRVMEIDSITDRDHPLPVTLADSITGYLDIGDEEKCNWMMFVEPAQNWSEINLILYEVDEELYFVCIKSLTYKGSQLRYSYAEPYANKYGLALLKREPSDFYCDACDLDFPSKMVKMRHVKSSKCMANLLKQNDLCTDERRSPTQLNQVQQVIKNKRNPVKIIKGKRKSALRKAQCGVCKLEFDNKELLSVHMASHEDEERLDEADITDQEGMSHCPDPMCEQSVDSITELYQHIVEAHSKPCADDPDETPAAEEVNKRSVNADLTMTDYSDSQTYQNELEIPKSTPPTCKVCFKVVTTVSQLAVHMKTHNNEDGSKFFKCFLCDERFKAPLYVRKHVAVHAVNGKYTCPQCPHREYDSWEKCRKHVYSIHSGKEYPCLECGRVFSREDKLRIHALTHTNVKNHMCDICGRQFARKDKLLEHIRNVHKKGDGDASGIPLYQTKTNKFRPKVASSEYHRFIYKCLDCSLGFKRRGMLVNHLAKCHPSKEMSSVPELNLPILREQREYYCSHCSRAYKSSFKRKMHMIKCHPGSSVPSDGASQPVAKYTTLPFACDYCHKQYANKAKLTEHLRVAHPEHPAAVVERPPRTFIQTEQRLSEQSHLTTADLTHQDVVTLIQPVYPTTGEPVTISLQGINLGDGTRVDNNDLLTQALSANELQATFDFQQQCGGAVNQLGQSGGLELRVIQNPNLSIDLNSLQMASLSNNSNITFTVPVSSLNPMTSLTNQIISSSNNLPSLDNNAVSQTNHRALFGNL